MRSDKIFAALSGYLAAFGITERPQTPRRRDYIIEKVRIPGGSKEVVLDGELTLPRGNARVPGLVLITGSGPQNKNEEVAGHKIFLVLSDFLTRAGFGVLRFDDRGVGSSSGDFATATPKDLASDNASAMSWLKAHSRILPAQTGYIGHSEGGYLAPMAQALAPAAFHVYLAGPALPLVPDVMSVQLEEVARAEGVSENKIKLEKKLVSDITTALKNTNNVEELRARITALLTETGAKKRDIKANLSVWGTPWAMAYAHHEPAPLLTDLDIPVLALFGELDLQVSAAENAPVMRTALRHPSSEVKVLKGLNHLFQPTQTGRVSEYLRIRTTLDQTALDAITDWLSTVAEQKEV